MRWILTLCAALCTAGAAAGQGVPNTLAIVGGTVVDVETGDGLTDAVVLIEGNRISAIGPRVDVRIPAGTRSIDASGLWLLPGLINVHVHFGLVLPGAAGAALADETEAELALRMASNARATLNAGITTVRIPGDRGHVDLALKRAIEAGAATGPRIFSAGEMVQVTGGHGSDAGALGNDGPDEFSKATRREIRLGADWIKLAISGGIATPGGDIAASFMTNQELAAVTDIAHRHGVKVTAHSGSPQATMDAIEAGVDCIEHGYFLTPEVFAAMQEAGTWYVPTIVVSQPATLPFFERIGSPQWYLDRVTAVGERHWAALQHAIDAGTQIALGTDQFPHEPNDGTIATVREAEYYVEAGMTPLQALQAATSEAARLLGAQDDLGSLSQGKFADLIAVPNDPTRDISALREIVLVVKDGRLVRHGH